MKSIIFLISIIQIAIISNVANAHQVFKRSYEIKEHKIYKTDSNLVLKFEITSKVKGDFKFFIDAPNSMTNVDKKVLDSALNINENETIKKRWEFNIPDDGRHYINIGVKINPDNRKPGYLYYSNNSLYFKMNNKSLQIQKYNLDKDDITKPVVTKGNAKAERLKDFNSKKRDKILQNYITVQISGTVYYKDKLDERQKGVPVRVWLDWDYDEDRTTGYTPYFWDNDNENDRHIGWDDADMDGNFWFSFTFESDKNANEIADYIRPYVSNGNAGCSAYNGELLPTDGSGDVPIDITQSTTEVTESEADIETHKEFGAAIRNLTRAWIFHKDKFNATINPIDFKILKDDDDPKARYKHTVEIIEFISVYPDAVTSYHEYGHVSHHHADADFPTGTIWAGYCPDGHWFRLEHNDDCAFTEGWAEFYAAACLDYWYSIDLPNEVEDTGGDLEDCSADNWNVYQFLDYG